MADPKKSNVLDEVRQDAKYAHLRRLKQQELEDKFQEARESGRVDEFLDQQLDKAEGEKPLSELTVKELVEMAKELGVEDADKFLKPGTKKQDVIDALEAARKE